MNNKAIVEKLGVTFNTVKNHVHNIEMKLGARNRVHSVVLAVENGMIEFESKKTLVGYLPDKYLLCLECYRTFTYREAKQVDGEPVETNNIYKVPLNTMCP